MGRWVLVTLILILSIVVAFVIFSVTGVIDAPALFWQLGLKISWLQPHLETYTHGIDSEAWINAQEEELRKQIAAVEERESSLQERAAELEQRSLELDNRQEQLEKRLASLEKDEAERRSIKTLANMYTEMTPEQSARIIEKLDQPLILDILLAMDLRDAADILIELPTNLAVALSKELGQAGN